MDLYSFLLGRIAVVREFLCWRCEVVDFRCGGMEGLVLLVG